MTLQCTSFHVVLLGIRAWLCYPYEQQAFSRTKRPSCSHVYGYLGLSLNLLLSDTKARLLLMLCEGSSSAVERRAGWVRLGQDGTAADGGQFHME